MDQQSKNNTSTRDRLRELIRKGQTAIIKDGKLYAPKDNQDLEQSIQEGGAAIQPHDWGTK